MTGAFDASLHLAASADLGAIDRFASAPRSSYAAIVEKHAKDLRRDGAAGGHLWCADAAWAADAPAVAELSALARAAGLKLSACVDPRDPDAAARAANPALDGSVLSPIHSDFDPAALARGASWPGFSASLAALGKPVFVTTAYGTAKHLERDSLALLADLLRRAGGRIPIVALHGAGPRFLDLVLLADAHANLLIDLSFTVLYYEGSSLALDWAWALRRLGPTRFLFGSDEPFAERARTFAAYETLMSGAGWSQAQKDLVWAGNARALFGGSR